VCARQAEKSWSKERCCEAEENYCYVGMSSSDPCRDRTASGDYLYRLSPGDPERYEPTGDHTDYQSANPAYWPTFGGERLNDYNSFFGRLDLSIGSNGPPRTAYCEQGSTYRGSPNEACGGTSNSDHVDLEVWRLL
jgi:hypothetical protein